MPVFRLDDRLVFPPVHLAEDGLLALGGDLRPERLLLGYTQGIFPWYAENLPILWHSPDPRMVMTTQDLVVQKSLREGFGLTVTEAMWKARPVVASAVGGIRDQIEDGVSGVLLADPSDPDALADALCDLLCDPGRMKALGRGARDRVRERFLGLDHLLKYAALLDRLDEGGAPARAAQPR